jgi:hypothetical protein
MATYHALEFNAMHCGYTAMRFRGVIPAEV